MIRLFLFVNRWGDKWGVLNINSILEKNMIRKITRSYMYNYNNQS